MWEISQPWTMAVRQVAGYLNVNESCAMAARQSARVLCLDVPCACGDQLEANAAQNFKAKRVTSFKAV